MTRDPAVRPSLTELERAIEGRDYEKAIEGVLSFLTTIDTRFGRLDTLDMGAIARQPVTEERTLMFATRFIHAFARLLADPNFELSMGNFERLLLQHRWIDLLFAQSGFRTSEFLLSVLADEGGTEGQWTFGGNRVLKMLASYSLNSGHGIDFAKSWQSNPIASAIAFLHFVGSRYLFWPRAFDLRERLLEWLPAYLDRVKLGTMTLVRIPEIYMHCSYAMTPLKHDIKANLMRQMRRACLEAGCEEAPAERSRPAGQKPTVVVIAEHLKVDHSVFRTHSKSVQALREDFHVVGIVFPDPVGTPIEAFFDEVISIQKVNFFECIRLLTVEVRKRNPDIVYFTGVGMIPYMIALASLRMAPIQCVSFGHTATTMSPTMDYMILPEDFVASPYCYSEKMLAMPPAAIPFARRDIDVSKMPKRPDDGIVRIAIPASTMKLNPRFFAALASIAKKAKNRIEFHFLPLGSAGLVYSELSRALRSQVPNVVVHMEMPFEDYLARLGQCDFFLSPFPYGNMNSIMDAMYFALPGVCLDGPEAHAHADVAIFARIGFPPELAAKTVEEYVDAAVRLIDDAQWRMHCHQCARDSDLDAAFFTGDASLFSKALLDLVVNAEAAPIAHAGQSLLISPAPL